MSDYSLVLKNCNLINEDSIQKVDIGIKGETELKELIIKSQRMQLILLM